MTRRIRFLCFLISGYGCLQAQNVDRRQDIDNFAVEYLRIASKQSPLYYGKEQEGYSRAMNHPYMMSTTATAGPSLRESIQASKLTVTEVLELLANADAQYTQARLSYCGVVYPEVMLRLDMHRDELVVLSPDYRNVVLFPESVDYAELYGQHIIYFHRDSLPGCPPTGYYNLLHSGNCKVLKRQVCSMNRNDRWELNFTSIIHYYLCKDGSYQMIRTKRGLLKTLYPYKKELKRFISTHHLQFRNEKKDILIRDVVNEYEKLSGL